MNDGQRTQLKSHVRLALSAIEALESLLEDEGRLPRENTREIVAVSDAWALVDDAAAKIREAGKTLRFTDRELLDADY